MTQRILVTIGLAAFAFSACALTPSDNGSNLTREARGRAEYTNSCAVCHGADARGKGPLAEDLRTAPTDLTRIAVRRGGTFPAAQITEIIDGRRVLRGHGPSNMPVWGKRFGPDVAAGSADRAVAQDRLLTLVEYLKSIQEM